MKGNRHKSVMVKDWASIPSANIPRSKFNLTRGVKTTFNSGLLVPLDVFEVLPGDTHSVTANIFARLATPQFPIMDNLYLDVHWFFVPMRLVWDNWERFMGAQDNPGDSTDYTIPSRSVGVLSGGLADYMGIPVGTPALDINVLPFRCYRLIWNQWYRDENLQDSVSVDKGDDGSLDDLSVLLRRGKRFDYYTSALPWPQKGPGVDLPLGQTAPISVRADRDVPSPVRFPVLGVTGFSSSGATNDASNLLSHTAQTAVVPGEEDNYLYADLSQATSSTINDLRQAFQIQKLQERDARGGTRYQELVLSHFGVRGGDSRLQRSEFLSGSTHRVGITQVPQTSGTAPTDGYTPTPQGNLAGFGLVMGKGGFTKSFTEHGYVLGLMSVRADLTYQHGLERLWSRKTKYDFYWPALSKIGEQAIYNREIYAQGTAEDDEVFGYQERFAEYRFGRSKITGLMRSAAASSLDAWHLSQDFTALPALNSSFIEENPPVDRIKAVTTEPDFILDGYIQQTAARPMPINGAPGYIDHF